MRCAYAAITTLVAKQKLPSVTGHPDYTLDKFHYDPDTNRYLCPQGQLLYNVSKEEAKTNLYRSKACKTCSEKKHCTKNKRERQIIHGEHHEVMARTDDRVVKQPELYKQRQMIVEHPFGTIKRNLGYTYFLLRGIEKVNGEAVMHCLVYNLKRVLSILGTKGLIAAMR